MIDTLRKINESGLSPNQYFLLFALKNDVEIQNINIEQEKKVLEDMGYMDNSLLDQEMSEQAFKMKAIYYIQLFPPIVLPTGVHARGRLSQIIQKLKIFVNTYPHSWEKIYEATQKYIDRYRSNGYRFMQNASNFLLDKNGDSTLALECDTLEHSQDMSTSI